MATNEHDNRVSVTLKELMRLKYQARGFSLKPSQPVTSLLAGRNRSRLRGRGLDFLEMRQYRPGDDIRTMDWRVTNRTGKPYVRVYSEERDFTVLVVVDQRRRMFFGSQWKMKSVIAAELAALSAWRVLDEGDRVGMILFDDYRIKEIRPSRSEAKILQGFSQLTDMNQSLTTEGRSAESAVKDSNKSQTQILFSDVLRQVENLAGHDSLIMLISDFSDCDAASLLSLKRISVHNNVIAVPVLDAMELDVSLADSLVVSQGEFQIQVDASNKALMESYQNSMDVQKSKIAEMLKRHAIPVLGFNTFEAVEKQITVALGGLP